MRRLQAFKYELMPDGGQQRDMRRFAGSCRFVFNADSLKQRQERLSRHQRAMARKQKFSNNWKKAKANVTKTHQKIANVRRDHLHKATTTLSKNHAVVVVEDLQVRSMSKSAAGTAGQPGRNVKAKSGLNRSILSGSRSLGAVGIPVLGRGGCQREQPA